MTLDIRNNFDHVADIAIYVIKPRTIIPDIVPAADAAAATTMNMTLQRCYLQGVYDKIGTTSAQALWPLQIAYPAAVHPFSGVVEITTLHKRWLTLFDSELFTRLFEVKEVHKMRLKPNDTAFATINGSTPAYMDGVELYMGAETLGWEAESLVYVDIKGVVGHLTNGFPTIQTKHATNPLGAVGAVQDQAGLGYDKAAVDIMAVADYEIEIFDVTLQPPAIAVNTYSNEASKMDDAVYHTTFT